MISQRLVNVGRKREEFFGRGFPKNYLEDEGNNQFKMNPSDVGHSQDVDHRAKEEEAENRQKVLACRIETLDYTLAF